MKVLVDSSVWLLALKKKKGARTHQENEYIVELLELSKEGRVVIIGPVRQEILSGISNDQQFRELKIKLEAYEDLVLRTEDYETAAEFYNKCKKSGLTGSYMQFLLCSVAYQYNMPIYSIDNDLKQLSDKNGIHLYKPRFNN